MRLALVTCAGLPAREVDDRWLCDALGSRGATVEQPVWDDAGVEWSGYDAVLIRTTWDYARKLRAFRAWAGRVAARTLLLNPAPVVDWNTHKRYLRELEREGVPVVPTRWLARGSDVDVAELAASLGSEEGLLKPCVGATARETLRFVRDGDGLARARAHVARLLPREDLMLQPFVRGVLDRGEWSAVFVEGRLRHAVRKVPAAGDYRVQDDFGGRDEPYAPSAAECVAAEHAMAAAEKLLGTKLLYGRTDWLWLDDDSLALVELELVEPSLYFRHCAASAAALAEALMARGRAAAQG